MYAEFPFVVGGGGGGGGGGDDGGGGGCDCDCGCVSAGFELSGVDLSGVDVGVCVSAGGAAGLSSRGLSSFGVGCFCSAALGSSGRLLTGEEEWNDRDLTIGNRECCLWRRTLVLLLLALQGGRGVGSGSGSRHEHFADSRARDPAAFIASVRAVARLTSGGLIDGQLAKNAVQLRCCCM